MTNTESISPDEPARLREFARVQRVLANFLLERYGPVLSLAQLALVLGYKSTAALEQSRLRGHLPIRPLALPHRRGAYFLAPEVARYLASAQYLPACNANEDAAGEKGARLGV